MIRLIPSLPAAYVIARVVWPLPAPLALRLGLAALLLVASIIGRIHLVTAFA